MNVGENPFKRFNKLKAILIYTIKSLTCFNGEEIESEDKEFPDSIYMLNKTLIKRNCHFIQSRPRSLRYCFVTDLFLDKEGINEEQFDLIQGMPEYEVSNPMYTELQQELNDLYGQVNFLFSKILYFGLHKVSDQID